MNIYQQLLKYFTGVWAGRWPLAAGYWVLATRCWLLVSG